MIMVKAKSKTKPTKYHIDQSGKIEQTNRNSILALTNGTYDTIIVSGKTKRRIQEIFRRNGQIRNFILFTFSALLAFLLKRNKNIGQVLVDTEYPGKDAIIKNIVLEMLSEEKTSPDIHFGFVGKESPADLLCREIARGRKKANLIINKRQILVKIKKTEVGKQLKDT